MTDVDLTNDLIDAVAARLDLREPNRDALRSLALAMDSYFEDEQGEAPWEAVIDAATGVGKTFILAAAIEYYASLGTRNFIVITPGKTILEKTINNFTANHPKSVLGGMETEPLLITADNFSSPAMRAAMEDPEVVKLFVFTVQSLTRPTSKQGRRTHKFQEGLGKDLYSHLDSLEDLIVFADEHHIYHGPAFSRAIRDLTPRALVGLTATPNEQKLKEEGIPVAFRYPLAAAIAERYVKTPIIVGRKDDLADPRTKLADGLRLLEAKESAIEAYRQATGADPIRPVMLVVAPSIEEAEEFGRMLEEPDIAEGRYGGEKCLVVHSDAGEEALVQLEAVEEPDSPVQVIISVGMLKEGWDVKNVYVIASMRASISKVLTEQTMGRGLRLPWGHYTGVEMLDTLEIVAHERYEDLLKEADVINEAFIDWRTHMVAKTNERGETEITSESEKVEAPVGPEPASTPSSSDNGADPASQTEAQAPEPSDSDATSEGRQVHRPEVMSLDAREEQAREELAAQDQLLAPRDGAPSLEIPILKRSEIENPWSLKDIVDDEPFRKLGQRLATDPAKELRRIKLSANIVTGPDGLRRTEVNPQPVADAVEAQPALIPREQAATKLADRLLNAPAVPAVGGQAKKAGELVDAFIEGLGDKAGEVLGGYLDRAAGGLIELVTEEQRSFKGTPSYSDTVTLKQFEARRKPREKTSTNRVGKFERGVGYTGYRKSFFDQDWFDSEPERAVANLLDDAKQISAWLRLQSGDLEIAWEGGNYNPDLIAIDSNGDHWLIEVKRDKDRDASDVVGKRQAAKRWASHVNASDVVGPRWHYLFLLESDIKQARGSWDALVAAAS